MRPPMPARSPQELKDAFPCRPDVPQFHPCPEFLQLTGESRHERLGQCRVRAESVDYNLFLINPDTRLRGGDGIAVIGFGKQGGFSEEFALARGMQDHKVVIIDCAADQA